MKSYQKIQSIRDRLPGPKWAQSFWTWLSGIPHSEETLDHRWNPTGRLLGAALVLALSLSSTLLLLKAGDLWLFALPLTWLLTTGALRYFFIVPGHYAAHGTLAKTKLGNRVLGELFSTLFFTASFDAYRRDHARFHHSWRLGTGLDPDVRFLASFGFLPGQSVTRLWLRLVVALFSPRYHLSYLTGRAKWNLLRGPRYRLVSGWAYLSLTAAFLAFTGFWLEWLIAFALPATFGFQASALLQYLSEHRWWLEGERGAKRTGRLTFGRFLLLEFPERGSKPPWKLFAAKSAFWLRVFLVQLPTRLAVLVGDLPQHDLHHRRPKADWANAALVRHQDVLAGSPGWPENYEDRTGTLVDFIGEVFRGWSKRPPLTATEKADLTRSEVKNRPARKNP